MSASSQARHIAVSLLSHAPARRAALRLASAWGRSLVLVYHRIAPAGAAPHEIVRSLPSEKFREQLEALASIGEIVPLRQLLEPPHANRRPRFAITFDDDDPGHVENALPVLRAAGAQATFFLSGRIFHNLPPYWWLVLEHSIRSRGLDYTRGVLGLGTAGMDAPADLAIALEGTPLAERVASLLPLPVEPEMTGRQIRALTEAGMSVGFHTLHHPVLSLLEGHELETAMTVGRRELAAASGAAVDLLAYPYGRVNPRAAAAAERAAFSAAWATGGRPVTHRSDRFILGRWEPETLSYDDFITAVAVRLLRSPTAPRSARPAV
jgi:peptidoglycan/xylan/chitin deacetylase (PgdA/CDA1 family)